MSVHRTPANSSTARRPTTPVTPSPTTTTAAVRDAAKTFIRRPNTKRRSLENMETYKKQQQTYAEISGDQLLQGLMKIFEDIPSRVSQYPQMRRDIKQFLEEQSDKGLKMVFEISSRVKALDEERKAEAEEKEKAARAPSRTSPSNGHEDVLRKLGEMEAALTERIGEMERTIQTDLQGLDVSANDRCTDLLGRIADRIEDAREGGDQTANIVEDRTHALLKNLVGGVAGEVVAAKDEIVAVVKGLTSADEAPVPVLKTYASAAASKPAYRPALHSLAITLEGSQETADEVLARVRKAVDARGTGLKINKVRKAKNQTVILGCDTREEMTRVKKAIESRGDHLKVVPMENKNPLVILRDVFMDEENEDILEALHSQNGDIFMGLPEEEKETVIKFKKRTRNPKAAHIILQVRPSVWRRMTEAGALYLDLQRVTVEDQSPLIQCTKCLAFGHGRKFCTESVDRCSHCGGPHLREKCADFTAGNEPQCCNCSHSGLRKTDHNAFSVDCPVRRKWDYLARTNTSYA
ncbi:unnamed protein product [Arctia plantaginis]|uniref:Gag-like protein n=1 Tax=Arctia plantaginis TaxID=874455 RepID=A0A8S1BAD3_ARCPL|nr:unnamed protein product [Arctia plantaginis]